MAHVLFHDEGKMKFEATRRIDFIVELSTRHNGRTWIGVERLAFL